MKVSYCANEKTQSMASKAYMLHLLEDPCTFFFLVSRTSSLCLYSVQAGRSKLVTIVRYRIVPTTYFFCDWLPRHAASRGLPRRVWDALSRLNIQRTS